MSQPKEATVQRLGLSTPADFTRESFGNLIVKAHADCEIEIAEAVCFLEPHANGELHLNCLVRSKDKQYRWKVVGQRLLSEYKVSVNFGETIETWSEGIVYGRVASEHKPPEMLDKSPTQRQHE